MLVSYDNDAKAVYITLMADGKVAKTIEFDTDTYLDLTKRGELIGIEMLNPTRPVLLRIAKQFHHPELSRIYLNRLLKAVA